ncbi:hypothetical protein JNJ66_07785 [Candidatus Saccharibacteria bacterium]|nr:hypothetical protein [Candidatus Saccharibacteria bacterium]
MSTIWLDLADRITTMNVYAVLTLGLAAMAFCFMRWGPDGRWVFASLFAVLAVALGVAAGTTWYDIQRQQADPAASSVRLAVLESADEAGLTGFSKLQLLPGSEPLAGRLHTHDHRSFDAERRPDGSWAIGCRSSRDGIVVPFAEDPGLTDTVTRAGHCPAFYWGPMHFSDSP